MSTTLFASLKQWENCSGPSASCHIWNTSLRICHGHWNLRCNMPTNTNESDCTWTCVKPFWLQSRRPANRANTSARKLVPTPKKTEYPTKARPSEARNTPPPIFVFACTIETLSTSCLDQPQINKAKIENLFLYKLIHCEEFSHDFCKHETHVDLSSFHFDIWIASGTFCCWAPIL